ncbi:MAG TPA: DUF5687 family protein [Mucilaginibacter sp.]|nr:DUF5687 family protein [Mucilaginibacter sp.]
MTSTFLRHELKAFWRSKNTGKSIVVRVVMGLLILYFLLIVVVIGFNLDALLKKASDGNIIGSYCGIILLYYLIDLFSRLQLQDLPTLRVQPYLQLPVKRNSLVRYLAFTALFSVFNLWPFLLFVPFVIKVIIPASGGMAAIAFILSIAGLTIFNNYLALYLKRKANLNGWIFLIAAAAIILIGLSDFLWHIISIRSVSYFFFGNLAGMPFLALIPLLLGAAMYYLNFLYLRENLYLEELGSRKAEKYKSSTEYPFLNSFGRVGDLTANELKLIFRNKRPRSAFIMGLFMMFYGLIFYTNPKMAGEGYKVFVSMFMTGIFIINYGQFMYSWQAAQFDGILVRKSRFIEFLKAKYLLFTIISTFFLLLTTPYAYFGWKTLVIEVIMYLWNIGVNATLVLYFANRNYKRIDLSKGAAFNWEGVGSNQWILSIPLLIAPYVIYGPFALLHHADTGLALLAVIGLTFVITRNFWIKKLETDFYNRRYQIAEGFRMK